MNHITRQRILGLIKEAVIFMPSGMGYKRPNTFAIINGLSDFNKDNLGYRAEDIQNNDVWTRKMSSINQMIVEYPVVAARIASNSLDMENGWESQLWVRKDAIQIYCLDRYVEQKSGGTAADRRSVTQIMDDCEAVVNKVMEYLKKVRPYKVQVTAGQYVEDFYHPDFIDWAQTNNRIVSSQNSESLASLNVYESTYLRVITDNLTIRTGLVEYPTSKDMVVGSSAGINTISLGCDDGQFTWSAEGSNISLNRQIPFGR